MEFGIALASTVDSWKAVRRAEELGFDYAWFYDTQMLCADVFVAMALAAEHTSKIRLATGVVVPSNRIAPVTANALASLNALAPGRVVFGVGTGFTARNTMGLRPWPLGELREYIRVVRALLAGETVEWAVEGKTRKIRFLNPDAGLINIADPIPVHVSAFAPRARALTAEVADGWINFMAIQPVALHELGEMRRACEAIGRAPSSLYATGFALGCVLADGEAADAPRARAQAGPMVPVFFHALMEGAVDPTSLPDDLAAALAAFRAQYERYEPADARYLQLHTGHLMWVRPEEERFVTAELLTATTLTGTVGDLRERVRAIDAAGYDQLAIQLVPGQEAAVDDWARVFEL